MPATVKRKTADTKVLLFEAQSGLATIDARLAELDAGRLEIEPANAVKVEVELAAARRDAERRIALLNERVSTEQRQRQAKAQAALIARVEKKFAERDALGAEVAKHLAAAVAAFRRAVAANGAAAMAWPFDPTDARACLFGRSFVASIAHELYRISGKPYQTLEAPSDFEFPGAACPSATDPRPESVTPLVDRLREATAYATRQMRGAPVRSLPQPAPIEAKPPAPENISAETAAKKPDAPPSVAKKTPVPEYVFRVDFIHVKNDEQRTEEVRLGPNEIAEASLDGLGATGPRGREIALRMASERVPANFVFAGKPESLKLDLDRLTASINGGICMMTMTPEQATQALADMTANFHGSPSTATPTTPGEAQARIAAVAKDKTFARETYRRRC